MIFKMLLWFLSFLLWCITAWASKGAGWWCQRPKLWLPRHTLHGSNDVSPTGNIFPDRNLTHRLTWNRDFPDREISLDLKKEKHHKKHPPTGHRRHFNVYSTLVQRNFIEIMWKQRWFSQCPVGKKQQRRTAAQHSTVLQSSQMQKIV